MIWDFLLKFYFCLLFYIVCMTSVLCRAPLVPIQHVTSRVYFGLWQTLYSEHKALKKVLLFSEATLSRVFIMSVKCATFLHRSLKCLGNISSFTTLKLCNKVHLYEGLSPNCYPMILRILFPEELKWEEMWVSMSSLRFVKFWLFFWPSKWLMPSSEMLSKSSLKL